MSEEERQRTLAALFHQQPLISGFDVEEPDDPVKKQKYRNKKVDADGFNFDSTAEYNHYLVLKARLQAGDISDLEVHPKFMLQEGFKDSDGNRQRPIYYEADFSYYDNDHHPVVVDVKGVETATWKIKRKLFLKRYPELRLEVIAVAHTSRRGGRKGA